MSDRGQVAGDVLALFESLRWPDGAVCPHCGVRGRAHVLQRAAGASRTRPGAAPPRRRWKCGACRRQFSVLSDSVFHGSRLPASTWLAGLQLLLAVPPGVPDTGAGQVLVQRCGIDRGTAAHVLSRLRAALVATGR